MRWLILQNCVFILGSYEAPKATPLGNKIDSDTVLHTKHLKNISTVRQNHFAGKALRRWHSKTACHNESYATQSIAICKERQRAHIIALTACAAAAPRLSKFHLSRFAQHKYFIRQRAAASRSAIINQNNPRKIIKRRKTQQAKLLLHGSECVSERASAGAQLC